MRARVVVLALVVAVAAAGCSSGHHAPSYHAAMAITPASTPFDGPFTMALRGLPAATTVELVGTAADYRHTTWTSRTTFRVPSGGVLTLADPATSGSYTGVDPLGPYVTLRPPSDSAGPTFVAAAGGTVFHLSAMVGGKTVASAQVTRQDPHAAIVDTPLRPADGGLYGELIVPRAPAATPRPGVVIFGGSEGGDTFPVLLASVLAADGYPALALAYFGEPGLPSSLHDIPLEYFERAVQRLRAVAGVDPEHVLIDGDSRGGEAALLLGATYPSEINGVIAGVPSSVVYAGYPSNGQMAWTLHGSPVEEGTTIPVERIRGPILQSCATDDRVWSSCAYQSRIVQRLQSYHFGYPVTSLRFAGAGHLAGPMLCCFSSTPTPETGGTLAADGAAQAQGSAALRGFLAKL